MNKIKIKIIAAAALAAVALLAPRIDVLAARVRVHSVQNPPPAFELPASFDGSQLPINYASPEAVVVGAEKTSASANSNFFPAAAPAAAPAALGGPPPGMPAIPEDYQLMWAPTVPPRLSDERMRNYSPVESAAQKLLRKEGAAPAPEKDCVKTPAKSGCNCKEIIHACEWESDLCGLRLDRLTKEFGQVEQNNFRAQLDHPLLNTLAVAEQAGRLNTLAVAETVAEQAGRAGSYKTKARRNGAGSSYLKRVLRGPAGGVGQCGSCFAGMMREKARQYDLEAVDAAALGAVRPPGALLLQKQSTNTNGKVAVAPSEFGHRVFDESPSWDAVQQGRCAPNEMQGLEDCLAFFWECEQNRLSITRKAKGLQAQTKHIYANPGEKPGLYGGF